MSIQALDVKLFFLINHGTANWLFDIVMPALTQRGYLLFLPYIIYISYKGSQRKDAAGKSYIQPVLWAILISFCAFPLADWLGNIGKHSIARVRPCHVLEGINLLAGCTDSYSMPSNHAVNSTAFAVPIFYLTREYIPLTWRLYPLTVAVAVSFSRVYVGVHYLSDVIAGALWGGIIAMLLSIVYERIRSERSISMTEN